MTGLQTFSAIIADGDFPAICAAVRTAGYGDDFDWSENVQPPSSAEEFAREAIFVICNSGMRFTVAQGIFNRVMAALEAGQSAGSAFGHKGKSAGIDHIWQRQKTLFQLYLRASDKVEFCGSLPWIGNITKYHLAKNFGADVAKPDVHLQRLAEANGTTPAGLCERIAAANDVRISTVDVVLWRACAIGLINSRKAA